MHRNVVLFSFGIYRQQYGVVRKSQIVDHAEAATLAALCPPIRQAAFVHLITRAGNSLARPQIIMELFYQLTNFTGYSGISLLEAFHSPLKGGRDGYGCRHRRLSRDQSRPILPWPVAGRPPALPSMPVAKSARISAFVGSATSFCAILSLAPISIGLGLCLAAMHLLLRFSPHRKHIQMLSKLQRYAREAGW